MQAQDIDISLMISQELRELRHGSAFARPKQSDALLNTANQMIKLRRDGARPMRFRGRMLFHTVGKWTKGADEFDHEMSIYVGDGQTVVVALSLYPCTDVSLRPSYRAESIPDLHSFERLVEQWCRDVLSDIVHIDRPISQIGPRDALQSLTAHALHVA